VILLLTPVVVLGLSALVFFRQPSWIAPGSTNNGRLLTPPLPLAAAQIDIAKGRWAILLVVRDVCDEDCRRTVLELESLPILLNRDARRVILVAGMPQIPVLPAGRFAAPPWQTVVIDGESLAAHLGAAGIPAAQLRNFVLLSDPRGNAILSYLPGQVHLLLEDLRKLLRFSRQA